MHEFSERDALSRASILAALRGERGPRVPLMEIVAPWCCTLAHLIFSATVLAGVVYAI